MLTGIIITQLHGEHNNLKLWKNSKHQEIILQLGKKQKAVPLAATDVAVPQPFQRTAACSLNKTGLS